MKPKTKLQREVVNLSQKHLPEINEQQKKYANKHALDHVAIVYKSGKANCMECGHQWKVEKLFDCPKWHRDILKEYTTCPSCKTKLKVKGSQQRTYSDYSSFGIITTCKGFQVIRLFELTSHSKIKQKKKIWHFERGQIWIAPNGKKLINKMVDYYIKTGMM